MASITSSIPSHLLSSSAAQARPLSPGVGEDFARQQVNKQQKNNFHSSSLKNMSVNKTSLHPSGVLYVSPRPIEPASTH
jgi:hypothetical protein